MFNQMMLLDKSARTLAPVLEHEVLARSASANLSGRGGASPPEGEHGSPLPTGASMQAVQAHPGLKNPIIGILGAKGGSGSSTLALNLSIALSLNSQLTTLVDADFRQPDLGQLLWLYPEHSLQELLARGSDIDGRVLNACCMPIDDSSCRLLSPPEDGTLVAKSNLTELSRLLNSLRLQSELWVVDLPKQLDKHFVTFIDSCDKIILTFEASISAVASCQRWLRVFAELGLADERIICVLNRAGSKHSGVESQLRTCFADREIISIPNASSLIWECSTKGVPALLLQPKHQYSRSISKLASFVSDSVKR